MMNSDVTYTQASADDAEDLVKLRIAAMRDSLERIGRFDPTRARDRFLAGFSPSHTWHILVAGQRAGFFVLKTEADGNLLLDHLYILESHQNRGIGSAVLRKVFAEADASGRAVKVGALRGSDSNRFYMRHGFIQQAEEEWDIYYVRPAPVDAGIAPNSAR